MRDTSDNLAAVFMRLSLPRIFSFFLFLLLLLSHHCQAASITSLNDSPDRQGKLQSSLATLIDSGGYMVKKGKSIQYAHQPDLLLTPASIWKIITAAAALKILGPDFRFQTIFYQNDSGDLYIEGKGDPFLVSEEVAEISHQLSKNCPIPIRRIILDDSAFRLASIQADGGGTSLNPYDAPNSALAVNFNTIHIMKEADGTIKSAEPQTPTLPIMRQAGAALHPGEHRIPLNQNPVHAQLYVVQLFHAFINASADGSKNPVLKQVPAGLRPVYVHASGKKLTRLIEELMLYSNNYIANQLFLTIGATVKGYPATWEKARTAVHDFLSDEIHLNPESFSVMEGSGLSRKNKITPRAMIQVLDYFQPNAPLLPDEKGHKVKSGTLKGVYSYAGYFSDKGTLAPFVIMLNQKRNTRDRVFKLLQH